MALRAGLRALAATLVVAASTQARAAPPDDDEDSVHPWIIALETGVELGIPAFWYWSTSVHQSVDWRLDGSWASWRDKLLTLDHWKFDTNPWIVNTIRHPLGGALDYHIARTNGLGPVGSTAFAFVTSWMWEAFVESREDISINDMIMNTSAGLSIGEPLYQIGQLWRGGLVSPADRARTALFSPFDALHDGYRPSHRWWRPRAWRSIDVEAGLGNRYFETGTRTELALVADVELVAHAPYVTPGVHAGTTPVGAWSRVRTGIRLGDLGSGNHVAQTLFHTETSLAGHYAQDGSDGEFLGIGTAFTYRKERLFGEWDRLCMAHFVGPLLELSHRTASYAVRWSAAAYFDFALVQAHVFGPSPWFLTPPPYASSLEADGYYYGLGASAQSRLRLDRGPWSVDVEGSLHRWAQLAGLDSSGVDTAAVERGAAPAATSFAPHNIGDWRAFLRGAATYRFGTWGIGASFEGAYREARGRSCRARVSTRR